MDHGRPAVAATEVELAEAGYSNASSFLDIRRPPGVDLRAGPVVNVAAEVSSGWREIEDICVERDALVLLHGSEQVRLHAQGVEQFLGGGDA